MNIMTTFFTLYLTGITVTTLIILFKLFSGNIYNRFVGILVLTTNVLLILVLIGFIDNRADMYVDIALTYALLGFLSSIVLAKFIGGKRGN